MAKIPLAGLGDRIRQARQRVIPEMRQVDLGVRVGRSGACVSGWESGRTEPNYTDLKKLSIALNVSVIWLMDVTGEGDQEEGNKILNTMESHVSHAPLIKSVPLLDLFALENWSFADSQGEHVQTSRDYEKGLAAAFLVNTDAVEKVVKDGDFAIVERVFSNTHNDIHLVRPKGKSGAPTLRRYKVDGGVAIYSADDAAYSNFKAQEVDVIGRVSEVLRRRVL